MNTDTFVCAMANTLAALENIPKPEVEGNYLTQTATSLRQKQLNTSIAPSLQKQNINLVGV